MSHSPLLGVDIGGTNMKIAVFSQDGVILEKELQPTEAEKGFADVLERAMTLIKKYAPKGTKHVGVCVPGLVTQPDGVLVNAPNIADSKNFPLKITLEKKLGMQVEVANDAQCFALAEAVNGVGKGYPVVCGITVGTGVGGGLVVDGKIFHGAHGFAAEIGHMLLKPGEPPYPTDDTRGEVEQFFSGTAFAKRCDAAQSPDDFLKGATCSFLHPDIFKEVAWMCTSLTYAYDPSVIIFGGTTGKSFKPHLGAIREELEEWLLPGTPLPVLEVSSLEHPGAMGAALLTLL